MNIEIEGLNKKIQIQQEAEAAHVNMGKKSIIGASVGVGKTYIAINRFNDYYNTKKKFKALFTGARTIYSINFKTEIEKSNNNHLLSNIEFICNKSLHKHLIKKYDIIIIDEIHKEPEMTLEFLKKYLEIYPNTEILGLTGTPLSPTSDLGKEYYSILPISYTKLLDSAIDDKMLNNYSVNVIYHDLDDTNKNVKIELKNGKTFYQTEYQRYKYLSDKYNQFKMRKGWQDGKFPYELVQLKSLFKNSITKKDLVYSLLFTVNYKKVLIYAGTIEQCESMKFPYYHSKLGKIEKEDTYEGFVKGKFKEMTNVGMLKESVSIPELDTGLIMCIDASPKAFTQSLGRLQRLSIGSTSNMYVLCARGTIEEEWLNKAISLLDFTKVNYFSNLNEFKNKN